MSTRDAAGVAIVLSGFLAMGWAIVEDRRTGGFRGGRVHSTELSAVVRYAVAIALLLAGSWLLRFL